MSTTRLTYHEVEVAPDEPTVVKHPRGSTLKVLDGGHTGGGGASRWTVKYVVLHPRQVQP